MSPSVATKRCVTLATRKHHKIKLVVAMSTDQFNVEILVDFSGLPPSAYHRHLRLLKINQLVPNIPYSLNNA